MARISLGLTTGVNLTLLGTLTFSTSGNGISFSGGGTITGTSGAITLTAFGTNQNITLVPSGTGQVVVPNGSSTKPGIGFTADPTRCGLYRVALPAYEAVGVPEAFRASTNGSAAAPVLLVGSGTTTTGIYGTDTTWSVAISGLNAFTLDSSRNATFAGNLSGAAGKTLSVGGAEAAATTCTKLTKAVTAIADATGTAVLTVTIPNAAHSASLRVRLVGSLGAGGAIGANEATGTVSYDFAIARTVGVNAATMISSAYGSAMASVAGAATITVTAAASAIAGAVGDPNTFTVNVTITKGSGASANHTCMVVAEIANANATGISLS